MRLGFHEISAHLKNKLAPVYVVTGDEPLQLGEAADQIRSAARNKGFSERKILDVGAQFDWQELIAESNNLSLFAEQRILDLRIRSGKPGTEGSKALTAYCANLPQDTLLLVSMPKLDQQQTRSKWYKVLESAGVIIQVWPVNQQRLAPWIEQRLRQKGLIPETDVVNMLAERVEGNLLAASQEIEKLLLLFGPGIITAKQLTASVADSARFDVFSLVDAALDGKPERCVRILQGLKNEGTPAAVVLWALSREIRQLAQISQAAGSGLPMSRLFADYRIWDTRKPLVGRALKRLPLKKWQQLLTQCGLADMAVKGQSKQDPWLMLEEISIQMTGLTLHKKTA